MDSHAIDYYSGHPNEMSGQQFYEVIALHQRPDLDWSAASKLAPGLTKGWYELSRLTTRDRIDFTRDYWFSKLIFRPHLTESLNAFFNSLDDIGIFLTKQHKDNPFEVQFVYSLSEDSGFFHGGLPAKEDQITALQNDFPDYLLPKDYISFLEIHNGFSKLTDTGIMKSTAMRENYESFQLMLYERDPIIKPDGVEVNPLSLIPFYKSFGMPFYQCFWGEWYPENEMGNVYYSDITRTISDCTKTDCHVETMAFETFTDWLIFYIEKIN